jgi:HAD superfamily hydrolase (TIGR01450 family)
MSDRLIDLYDAVLLDLDGTVYRGAEVVPGAPATVTEIRAGGVPVRFVTNNASRSPAQVAGHLTELGIVTEPAEICTSAQAAATMLALRLAPGAAVLVVGAEALADEVSARGLRVVTTASEEVVAVVQGLSRTLGWSELSEACVAVRAGALWVACNVDPTLPTERGQLIGNGALVAAVSTVTGRRPLVAGKPDRTVMDQAVRSAGAHHPLVVGDRLDTDMAAASAAEMDALLVLSGVTTPGELLAAGTALRPRYLAADLTSLTGRTDDLAVGARPEWGITPLDGSLSVRWSGDRSRPDPLDLLRALCAVHRPDHGEHIPVVAGDHVAGVALAQLGLTNPVA